MFMAINKGKTTLKERKMTKAELIDAIAEKAGLTKADAAKALAATLGSVTDALRAGEKVALIGFGTFSVSQRAARTGKNPQTGQALAIPASKAAKFKAGQQLKDAVN
jgi:DNA-binding protein HU-beta